MPAGSGCCWRTCWLLQRRADPGFPLGCVDRSAVFQCCAGRQVVPRAIVVGRFQGVAVQRGQLDDQAQPGVVEIVNLPRAHAPLLLQGHRVSPGPVGWRLGRRRCREQAPVEVRRQDAGDQQPAQRAGIRLFPQQTGRPPRRAGHGALPGEGVALGVEPQAGAQMQVARTAELDAALQPWPAAPVSGVVQDNRAQGCALGDRLPPALVEQNAVAPIAGHVGGLAAKLVAAGGQQGVGNRQPWRRLGGFGRRGSVGVGPGILWHWI